MKNIDENEMIYNETLDRIPLNDYKKVCGSCTLYIVLFVVFLVASAVIGTVFIYYSIIVFKKEYYKFLLLI